jgi:predicted Zn-dependent protease
MTTNEDYIEKLNNITVPKSVEYISIVACDDNNTLIGDDGIKSSSISKRGASLLKTVTGIKYFDAQNSTDIQDVTRLLGLKKSIEFCDFPQNADMFSWKPSQHLYIELKRILSKIGPVLKFDLIFNQQVRDSYTFSRSQGIFINEAKAQGRLSIFAVIEFEGTPFMIKDDLVLMTDDNCDYQVTEAVQKIVATYGLASKKDFINLKDKNIQLILPCGLGGIFIHEAIGHALEADYFFDDSSIMRKKWNNTIADKRITIIDSCRNDDLISYKCSSDGSIPSDVVLIDKGIICGILTDSQYAHEFNWRDTGNGRSSDYEFRAIPRMRNTYLVNGTLSFNSILESTRNGLLATEIGGGQVDSITGDFMFNINAGLVIANGEIIGIAKPLLFTGNVLEILKKIDLIGNDLSFCGAMCGKKGQFIDVSYGLPTVRFEPMVMR